MFSTSRILLSLIIISFITISCSSGYKVINETASLPKTQLQGKVLESETKEPISGAEIWVEGTTISAISDKDGFFSIKVPRGYHEMYAEANGYEHKKTQLSIESVEARAHDFFLTRKVSQGSYSYSSSTDVYDSDSPSEKNKIEYLESQVDSLEKVIEKLESQLFGSTKKLESEKLKTFINQYINDELNCSLTNPEDIVFSKSKKDMLWVKDPVELLVVNKELGYKIRIRLNEFASQEYSEIIGLNVDADYFFEEMTPENQKQARNWEEKRRKYFNGSLRHFLIAMASDKSPLYFGYRLYSGQFVSNTSAMAYSSSSVSDVEKQKYELIYPNNLNGNKVLKFDEELRIEYVEKDVEDPNNIMGLDMYQHQTSWLSLNSKSVEFSDNGFFESPQAVEVKGVWRYTPVCKMIPGDYLPEIKK